MAKIVDYPRASFANSLQLADAVNSLGGECSVEMAADKMGKKVSGAFTALASAAVKYGLIASKKGRLSVQPLYRSIKLAYTEDEKRRFIAKAFLSPPLFRSIVERFEGRMLPVEHFEKLLIREFDVPGDSASRIAQYFLHGAKEAGIVSASGVVSSAGPEGEQSEADSGGGAGDGDADDSTDQLHADQTQADEPSSHFSISFRGPGLNSTVVVREQEDLLIVDAMLKKVSKALRVAETKE